MKYNNKGLLSSYTIITSIITGACFPLLGSIVAINLGIVKSAYLEGIILVVIGGFLAHWILVHTIHDIYHIDIEARVTFSKNTLKILLAISITFLFSIALFLTMKRGWPVLVFSIIGGLVSIYAKGLFYHESQMAIGAMFLIIGGFYVQVGTLNLEPTIWIKVICFSIFGFLSQYGWLLFYRLDDYQYDKKVKNKSILITKSSFIFLLLYFLL
jgi:hypothetical protein